MYGASLGNAFVTWDDTLLIVDNPSVQSINLQNVKKVFTSYDPELYIPLTFLSYQIDHLMGGMNPFVYHFTNLVLHINNSLFVAWFLYVILKRGWLALALGLLFLLHPLNTEAVVWASARKDVLSTLFFLASLISWIHFRDTDNKRIFFVSLALFLLGALSKVMVITLPIVFLMLDLLERRPLSRRLLIEKIPFLLIAVIFGIVAIFGKTQILVSSTLLQKILIACTSTVFYLTKFVFPSDLSVMYPYTKHITLLSPDFFIPAILTILLFAVAWFFRHRSRHITFGILFFMLTLIPTFTNFTKGGDIYFASDRYTYIPMIGLLIVTGVLTRAWMDRPGGVRAYQSRIRALFGFAGIICVLLGFLSSAQAKTWKDSRTLFEHVLARYPSARAARNNLGMEYYMTRQYDEAIREFDLALAIRTDPRTQSNRAAALVGRGSLDEALTEFRKALSLNPDIPDALYGIGNIYQKQGDLRQAAEQYRRTLDADPTYTNALNNLGAVYIQLEDWDRAIETLTTAIARKPDFVESYYNLAGVFEQIEMKAEAEQMYRKALDLRPDDPDALARLATLVYDRGEIDEAAQLLMSSLEIDSSNPTAVSLVLRMKKDGVAE